MASTPGQEVTFNRVSPGASARVATARRTRMGEPVKKIKETKKTRLKFERDILRTLQVNELCHAQGGTDNQNGLTAASGGPVCCA